MILMVRWRSGISFQCSSSGAALPELYSIAPTISVRGLAIGKHAAPLMLSEFAKAEFYFEGEFGFLKKEENGR